jgi:mannose-6-phosphate isomerase-like protein (cupin superfamily)
MHAYEIADLIAQQHSSGKLYHEFLNIPSLSMGIYMLPAGATDTQKPHTEDEVYYVVNGHATIRVGDEDRPVQPGSVIFVAAHVPHHFHTITEAFATLVFFAPAEYSRKDAQR